jgi:glycosyltransferase involved in cell wall biosynthesis
MNSPLISAVMVTYARTHHVEEAIQCFLDQTFENAELLIYNTCPEQTLSFDHPRIRIINADARPHSLSDARNDAIEQARGKYIITFDDDCIYLPNHFWKYLNHIRYDGINWVWLKSMFMLERGHITKVVQASENTLAFTKDAWAKSGRYQSGLSVGEDRQFAGKITSGFRGVLVPVKPEEITFLYGWDNGSYHISGHGWEAQGSTAYEKVRKTVQQQLAAGSVPSGKIELAPKLNADYEAIVKSFLTDYTLRIEEEDVCIVQLGRLGDIINALPIAKAIYDRTGRKPYWMISREFESILEGVSYVEPYPVSFTFHELNAAMIHANSIFNRVIKTQIYGQNHYQDTHTPSWPQESWRQAGFLDRYHDKAMRPLFDLRNREREDRLAAKLFRTNKPKLITNLTSAISVPFANGDKFIAAIMLQFGKQYEIVDIGKLRAERFYDVLGIYERADIIVSIDTATMHLAAAVDKPLVALVNPSHWLGPQLRFNCVKRIPYSEATIKTVCDAIASAPEWIKNQNHRDRVFQVLAKPVTSEEKLDLSDVCLWACAWSADENNLLRTLRVLRYCHSIMNFGDIVMLSYLPLPEKSASRFAGFKFRHCRPKAGMCFTSTHCRTSCPIVAAIT